MRCIELLFAEVDSVVVFEAFEIVPLLFPTSVRVGTLRLNSGAHLFSYQHQVGSPYRCMRSAVRMQ